MRRACLQSEKNLWMASSSLRIKLDFVIGELGIRDFLHWRWRGGRLGIERKVVAALSLAVHV